MSPDIEKRLENVRIKPLSPELKGKILSAAKAKWDNNEQFSPSFRLAIKIFFTAAASLIAVALIFDNLKQETPTPVDKDKSQREELVSLGITKEMAVVALNSGIRHNGSKETYITLLKENGL